MSDESPSDNGLMTVLKSFPSMETATLAAAALRAAGIDCAIKADDCGGAYPVSFSSSGFVVLVRQEDLAAARDLLEKTELPQNWEQSLPESESAANHLPAKTKGKICVPSLLAGLLIGLAVYWGANEVMRLWPRVYEHDTNADGRIDERWIYRNGYPKEFHKDHNHDGKMDELYYYRDGFVILQTLDNNFDGRPDWWAHQWTEQESFIESDTDFNGVADHVLFCKNMVAYLGETCPNKSTNIIIRTLFEHGVVREELRDTNGDGYFDLSTKYDPFYVPVQTNHIKLHYRPTARPDTRQSP